MENENNELRSDIYLLISTLCRGAPERELLDFLSSLEIESGINQMTSAWQGLAAAANVAEVSALEDEYQDLFIGIGKGEVIPFASWHLTGSLMDKPLAALRHDLGHLGLEREESVKEPEDHISAVCEVLANLIDQQKESEAKAFFNQHLSPWYSDLCRQIENAPSAQFYPSVAALMQAFSMWSR
ncbi:putative formate dehydrogenase-specific chaperone [Vibrio maritimus]|uniref:Putative formate dehydrogenase-specific chaperone n=1 Tax=Vibrio maritimus TaxID=990268 RepID=A0A090SIF7_9VIBR|nr:putative formate dehydrogenase-specific chaperone [Vibrio maritimus]